MGFLSKRNGRRNSPEAEIESKPELKRRDPNGNVADAVPHEDRHSNIIVVPQTPIEVPQLLIALGAQPLGTAVLAKDTTHHFQLMELPDDLTIGSGRYARATEFIDGETHVHGIRPSVVLAPDGTLLFAIDFLGGTTKSTIGLAWQETSKLLGGPEGLARIPHEVVFVDGVQTEVPYGSAMLQYANLISETGKYDLLTILKNRVAAEVGLPKSSADFEEHFKGLVEPIREKLTSIDQSRVGALRLHLGIAPDDQVPVLPQVAGQKPPMTLGS